MRNWILSISTYIVLVEFIESRFAMVIEYQYCLYHSENTKVRRLDLSPEKFQYFMCHCLIGVIIFLPNTNTFIFGLLFLFQ